MKEEVDKAIKELSNKAAKSLYSFDAMRFSQAVLNLSHAYNILDEVLREETKPK
jgi:hypothetical protein